ncbi:MAG: vWA domain-containing protein [Planctomycetota bacterium]
MSTDDQRQPDAPSFWERFRRWALRLSVAGIVVSLAVHVALLIGAALLLVGGGGAAGTGEGTPTAVEFAVMPESQFESVGDVDIEIDSPVVESLLDEQPLDVALTELTTEPSADRDLSVDIASSSGGESLSIEGTSGSGGASGGAASFFGIEARGNRFAYVVDVSGSMGQDGRMESMLAELRRSITELGSHVQFYIVFYSEDAFALGNRKEWTDATNAGKRWARQRLETVEPLGSTKPVPGFDLVSRIRPRADAIYFMTDGRFANGEADVDTILALNRERPTPVHCITFVTREGEASMRRIAEATGGSYTHVPGGSGP